jgi:hypothetical protein
MFPQQPQQQFRTAGADVQTFYKDSAWSKPPGVSHVYMMLIGGGGNGEGTGVGGGSGAVTTWYGAAQHVPNNLVVSVSTGNASNTTVNYQASSGLVALLTANGATTFTFGLAMNANQFTASGFFQSVQGQGGSTASSAASTTTFLSGGADTSTDTVTANYGYAVPATGSGFFQLQPIIVGAGGSTAGRGDIGCGGGRTGVGGPGLVLIASW